MDGPGTLVEGSLELRCELHQFTCIRKCNEDVEFWRHAKSVWTIIRRPAGRRSFHIHTVYRFSSVRDVKTSELSARRQDFRVNQSVVLDASHRVQRVRVVHFHLWSLVTHKEYLIQQDGYPVRWLLTTWQHIRQHWLQIMTNCKEQNEI